MKRINTLWLLRDGGWGLVCFLENAVNIQKRMWNFLLISQHKIIKKLIFADRHHFDNPVYSTSYRGGGPAPGPTNPVPSTHLPLNNGCSRVVNHFSTSASACSSAKKHVNIERDKLGGGATSVPNHYQDDTEEEMEHESGNFALLICVLLLL